MGEGSDLMLVGEVAAICRTNVSTVRFWIQTGKLPSLRPGRRRLVRRSDLESFLARSGELAQRNRAKDPR